MNTKLFAVLFFISIFTLGVCAQESYGGRDLAGIKSDFKGVGVVAHVKMDKIELVAQDVHPLYKVKSVVLESFKGKVKKGVNFVFYFHAEDDYDVQQLAGKEFVVFLESEAPVPSGGRGWYELENSKIAASVKLSAQLRKLKKK